MSKLLIVADIENKCAATARGLALATEMDLEPEVVAFTYTDLKRLKVDTDTAANIKKQLLSERKASLEARVASIAGDKHGIRIQVVWAEDIHSWIIKRAAKDCDVVVKSRHKSESLGHTSTDWHLLRECPVPVLLVSKKRWKRRSTVMATVDLGTTTKVKQKLNRDVVLTARHYAEILGTDLKVLCVIDVPKVLAELDLIDPRTWAEEQHKALEPKLVDFAELTGLPKSAFIFKRGPVGKTIVSEASRLNAQLVVMGTVGRRGVKAQVLGNTAEAALGLLRTDTLTLKP